jgi:hypothetical protein
VPVRRRHLVTALVLAGAAACQENPAAPTARLNEPFVLAPTEIVAIAETPVRIRFVGVFGDSRCPADAFCIQGGDAIVRIDVLSFGGGTRQYDLHTGNLQPVVHDDLTIALVQLVPYPFSSRTIQPEEYRATLRVSR